MHCKSLIENTCDDLFEALACMWKEVKKEAIEAADGRKDRDNPVSKKGSIVYVAYDTGGEVLYVGETSKSIKRRFISDTGGSHRKACNWYQKMAYVKYVVFTDEELPTIHRKMLEQALSIKLKPRFYGNRT